MTFEELLVDNRATFSGFAHILCGLLIREGLTTASELADNMEAQAERMGGVSPVQGLLELAEQVRSYDNYREFGVIDGGKQD